MELVVEPPIYSIDPYRYSPIHAHVVAVAAVVVAMVVVAMMAMIVRVASTRAMVNSKLSHCQMMMMMTMTDQWEAKEVGCDHWRRARMKARVRVRSMARRVKRTSLRLTIWMHDSSSNKDPPPLPPQHRLV